MKTIISAISFTLLLSLTVNAQDVPAKLASAKSAYSSGNLENSRFELQEALVQVNQVIGQEILKALPGAMGDMQTVPEEDDVNGANLGFAGLYVNRNYAAGEQTANLEIISDSPLLAGINTILSMPLIMNSDPNQKRVKIDGYKGLLQKNEDEETGSVSWTLQLPFQSSLLTFNVDGVADEAAVTKMINTIPVAKIVAISK